ncbi:hypothetical protein TH606_00955 [Thermodesulfatator autotrophicus]|uniref:Uncharacterized protein n=1 Tax=Thermodesulfatator autotrophicus TaxID=1795632 RepID=A0A177E9Z4_9BACT|nr:hypothetical protein TH606_00955 [Thermodesulfatator autotrophicus]
MAYSLPTKTITGSIKQIITSVKLMSFTLQGVIARRLSRRSNLNIFSITRKKIASPLIGLTMTRWGTWLAMPPYLSLRAKRSSLSR